MRSVKTPDYEPMFDALLAEKSPELFVRLRGVREIVIPVLKQIPNTLYSEDAEGHARQVLRLMAELYYPTLNAHFSSRELFLIGLLCLTHDIGMMPRQNMTDGYRLYQGHCEYSHDYVTSLTEKYIDHDAAVKLAALCLVHNKPVGRAKAHLMPLETPTERLTLIFLMFRIADILEIELHPGSLLRMMAPNIVAATIGEFDIDFHSQTITLVPAPGADVQNFALWGNELTRKVEESKEEFSFVGLSYKVKMSSATTRPLIGNNQQMSWPFSVFLMHNSKDKPSVRQLVQALKARGLNVWLDEEQLVPGRPWQEALEKVIQTTPAAAVLVGKDGLGPWEIPEMRACLSEFVDRQMPVIPVLLPDAPVKLAKLPLFLRSLTWVDLRGGLTEEALRQLQWGITGRKPD